MFCSDNFERSRYRTNRQEPFQLEAKASRDVRCAVPQTIYRPMYRPRHQVKTWPIAHLFVGTNGNIR
jgi:hypothetical protein